MIEPLSITASVVGIVAPALHTTRLLLDDLQLLKDAPKDLKRLEENVQSVVTALGLLEGIDRKEWGLLGADVARHSETTILSSMKACQLFQAGLNKWTRHSDGKKLAWQDRANVGFFKKNQVKAMSEQIQSCRMAINLIVGVANLYSSIRNSHVTEELKNIITLKQDELNGAITASDRQLIVLESKVEEMNLGDDEEEVASPVEGKTDALRQLEEEVQGVKASQRLLSELLVKAQEDAIVRAAGNQSQSGSITVTFGDNNSGFSAGVINGGVSGLTFGRK